MSKSLKINKEKIKCILNQLVYNNSSNISNRNLEKYLFLSEEDLKKLSVDLEQYLINIVKNENREWNVFDILNFLSL